MVFFGPEENEYGAQSPQMVSRQEAQNTFLNGKEFQCTEHVIVALNLSARFL